MSTLTNNYGLNKPDTNDFYDVSVQNENMDKIDEALKKNENHITDTTNPHNVTKSQIGLSNVPNVATNDQTPTYTIATGNTALTSGEKLSIAFGKIARAITSMITHLADNTSHITSAERTSWNAKVDKTTLADYLPLTGGTITGNVVFAGLVDSDEGGEILLEKPPENTLFTGNIAIDANHNAVRIFAPYNGSIRIFSIDFTSLVSDNNIALHTGNSARVVISDTEPDDTTVLWIS